MLAVRRQPFNRSNTGIRSGSYRRDARTHGLAAQMNGAGAALPDSAAVLCPVHVQNIPQDPKQWSIRRNIDGFRPPIHLQVDRHTLILTEVAREWNQQITPLTRVQPKHSARTDKPYLWLGRYLSLALTLPASLVAGYIVGALLDSRLHMPVLRAVGILLGVAAGLAQVFKELSRDEKRS